MLRLGHGHELQVEKNKESEKAKRFARVLFDTALLESGFQLEETKDFNSRVYALLADAFAIKRDITKVEPAAAADAEVCTGSLLTDFRLEEWKTL